MFVEIEVALENAESADDEEAPDDDDDDEHAFFDEEPAISVFSSSSI